MASAEIQYHEVVRLIDCEDCTAQTCSTRPSLANGFPPFFSFLGLICALLQVLEFFGKESLFFFCAIQLTAQVVELRLHVRDLRRCGGRAVSCRSIRIFFDI